MYEGLYNKVLSAPRRRAREALGPDSKIMVDRTGDDAPIGDTGRSDWTHEEAVVAPDVNVITRRSQSRRAQRHTRIQLFPSTFK